MSFVTKSELRLLKYVSVEKKLTSRRNMRVVKTNCTQVDAVH